MAQRFKGKGAVVTGSSHGIGRAVAMDLAAEGAGVVVNGTGRGPYGQGASDSSQVAEVAQEIKKLGGVAVASCGSVADFVYAERLIKTCVDKFGSIDILVNCAGIVGPGTIYEMSEQDWDPIIDVHLKGTFNCCRHACAIMKKQKGGRIVNTTSIEWLGGKSAAAYSAAKGGIVSLTRTIAKEMAEFGVTCNAIAPEAATRLNTTEEAKAWLNYLCECGQITKSQLNYCLNLAPPQAISTMYLFLATDEAANINGRVFACRGSGMALFAETCEIKGIYKEYKKYGRWTLDELIELAPGTLADNMTKLPGM